MQPGEATERAVIGALHFRWKDTTRQFIHPPVVGDALAAFALARAWFVGAGTGGPCLLDIAFHGEFSGLGVFPAHLFGEAG